MMPVMEMQSVEIRIPWWQVTAQSPVASGPYGTTYQVPDLGYVWVAPHMAQEAVAHSDEEICILVSPQSKRITPRLWLLAGFVAPDA